MRGTGALLSGAFKMFLVTKLVTKCCFSAVSMLRLRAVASCDF